MNLRMKSISLDSPEPHFDENTCLKGRNLSVPRVVESYNNQVDQNRQHRVHNSWVNLVRNRMHLNSSTQTRQQLRLNCNENAANSAPASYNHCNLGFKSSNCVFLYFPFFSTLLCDVVNKIVSIRVNQISYTVFQLL